MWWHFLHCTVVPADEQGPPRASVAGDGQQSVCIDHVAEPLHALFRRHESLEQIADLRIGGRIRRRRNLLLQRAGNGRVNRVRQQPGARWSTRAIARSSRVLFGTHADLLFGFVLELLGGDLAVGVGRVVALVLGCEAMSC